MLNPIRLIRPAGTPTSRINFTTSPAATSAFAVASCTVLRVIRQRAPVDHEHLVARRHRIHGVRQARIAGSSFDASVP